MEYRRIINVQFREYDRRVFEKSWEWLSDPELKKLTQTPDQDKEQQEIWFQSLKDRTDYLIEGVWRDEEPIGVIGLKNITSLDAEIFGFIGEKKYWGKAIGMDMMQHMLDSGKRMGLSSIYAKIRKDNPTSYRLHLRFGFSKESDIEEDAVLMRYHL